ncbi:MAG: NAD+ synthase [Planctomycetota bacterium]|jgi:NAD+ synthetase
MRIALAQINTTVGDFAGNVERIRTAARRADAALVVFPELTVCGYLPRDLFEENSFLDRCEEALRGLAADRGLPPLVVGSPWRVDGKGKPLCNAALLLRDGAITPVAKRLLPTYDVFDERRYFRPGAASRPVAIGGVEVGFTVCEDVWTGGWADHAYGEDPVADLVTAGAGLIVNLSASPYALRKPALRRRVLTEHARRHGVPVAMCNLVGANDQLIFDGSSFAVDAAGRLCAHAAAFAEDLAITEFRGEVEPPDDDLEDAIVLGIRDYFGKTGWRDAIVGMSGGVDSSLTACLAVAALGPDHVTGVAMPGPFSAEQSLEDARALAERLGIRFLTVPITAGYELLRADLQRIWGDRPFDVTEENLQARLRGVVLMSLANKEHALVLTPSNKSEFAMGYCTLYGDMIGALAPISDLYKTEVYALARRHDMPQRILERAPTAELRPGQTDQDSLPPYEVLDGILRCHLEERLRPDEIVARGYDRATVGRVLRTVAEMEYKRQQASPVLKVTSKAFGLGRRFPIVERFRGGVA